MNSLTKHCQKEIQIQDVSFNMTLFKDMTLFKRPQMRLGFLPDWPLAERDTVVKSNKQKEGDTEDETDEKDEAGPPGKADMEDPKGTGNTIMNDTPDVVSRYENKLDDEIIEVLTKTSSLENWKEESISQGIFPYPLIYIWNCICNGSTQALDSPDFQSQTPLQDLNKDMESSVSLIGLEIIWVFKGGGIGTWWSGTLL